MIPESLALLTPDCIYEVTVEVDEGFSLGATLQPWRGFRFRYRRQDTRRWRTFLLEMEGQPSAEEIQRLCATHDRTAWV